MFKTLPITGWVIVSITAALLSPIAAGAQPEPAAPLRVAVVDIGKVSGEYQALNQKDQELKQWLDEQKRLRLELEDFTFLSQENFNEVVQTYELAPPLPEEKVARLAELKNISAEKEKRFLALRAKGERTAPEEDEFNSLLEVAGARQQQLAELEQQILNEYGDKVDEAQNLLLQEVEEVITQYAQDQKYDLVLDRAWVFYGGDDITDRIIERLNQPSASDEESTEEAPAEEAPGEEASAAGNEGEEGGGG